jgi:mycothiol synthase
MSDPGPGLASGELEWCSPWSPATDDAMAARGLRRVRLLHQLRVPLPLADDVRTRTRRIEVRALRDDDTAELLAVNNRAFAWHPDQGGWTERELDARRGEPWFDPAGFLVHEDASGVLDGFCWTKVHPPAAEGTPDGPRPAAGEIYVIAVDPRAHGTGLGRALTVAGLDHLASQGLELALLYVEADNEPALALYEGLGFRVHHSDAGYAP